MTYDVSRRSSSAFKGDTLEVLPAYEEVAVRIQFWGDEIERMALRSIL